MGRGQELAWEKVLATALRSGGEFADLYLERTDIGSIVCDDNKIEKAILGSEYGIGLRVITDCRTSYSHSNKLSERDVLSLAADLSDAVGKDLQRPAGTRLVRQGEVNLAVRVRPEAVPSTRKVDLVREANRAARDSDGRVRQVRVLYSDKTQKIVMANSLGELVEEERIYTLFTVHVVAAEKDLIQTGYEAAGGLLGLELFDKTPPVTLAREAARRAIQNLEARRAPAGVMPAVLSSEAGGTMVHEAVGHGLEGDFALEGLSVYSGRVGHRVASPLITVIDDPTLAWRRGSYGYDDEGVRSRRNVLIEHGVLKGYLCDRLNAMKFQVQSSGNGRRESYKNPPVVRMSNTLIGPGDDDPEAILKDTPEGVFVRKMGGGQVNTVNGDFVFEVSEGYLIRNGQVGDPIRGATLTGNGPRVLESIDRVGSDLGFGIGTCGKDGQGVPISDGQPTIRIPEIVVGGAPHSS